MGFHICLLQLIALSALAVPARIQRFQKLTLLPKEAPGFIRGDAFGRAARPAPVSIMERLC